jgi:hypothetical protein
MYWGTWSKLLYIWINCIMMAYWCACMHACLCVCVMAYSMCEYHSPMMEASKIPKITRSSTHLLSLYQPTSEKSIFPWPQWMSRTYQFKKYIIKCIHWQFNWEHYLQRVDSEWQMWISNNRKVKWKIRWTIAWKITISSFSFIHCNTSYVPQRNSMWSKIM